MMKQWCGIERGRPAAGDDVVQPRRQNTEDAEG